MALSIGHKVVLSLDRCNDLSDGIYSPLGVATNRPSNVTGASINVSGALSTDTGGGQKGPRMVSAV